MQLPTGCTFIELVARFVGGGGEEMPSAPKSFVSRKGVLGGYEVAGWRYTEDAAWHIKANRKSSPGKAKAYVVRDGGFQPETASTSEKVAILTLIAQGEAGLPNAETDFLGLIHPD
jgi:hypothetical protein